MKKYNCQICGYEIETDKLAEDYICPICGQGIEYFVEVIEEEQKEEIPEKNCVPIDADNPSIMRIDEKCIYCGICKDTCQNKTGIYYDKGNVKKHICIDCGKCVTTCPTGAICPKPEYEDVMKQIADPNKVVIVSTSPAVRVAIGEEFGIEAGTFLEGKMVAALRKLGFDYVLDVTFGADMTIMEEASELLSRIQNKNTLPQFTSCCPAWVTYMEIYYPHLLPHLSTCKSPIGMQASMIKTYFMTQKNIDYDRIINVAVTPCTAKKFEKTREELVDASIYLNKSKSPDMDYVMTTTELAEMIRKSDIDFITLPDSSYDDMLGKGSGAGVIFGNTGGVMEATMRTAYHFVTGDDTNQKALLNFETVRGLESVKKATLDIAGTKISVAVAHGLTNIPAIMEEVEKGISPYQFIEVMNCRGGCIGGGGQPRSTSDKLEEIRKKRIAGLYLRDEHISIKSSDSNEDIKRIYRDFLQKPLSKTSRALLHTTFHSKREEYFKK